MNVNSWDECSLFVCKMLLFYSGVNALGEMAGGQEFIRCWEALSRPGATATEKTEAYAFLTR